MLRSEVYRNRKGHKMAVPAHGRKMTTHGPRRTIHDGNRHVMLKWSATKQAFLLSPQFLFFLTPFSTSSEVENSLKPFRRFVIGDTQPFGHGRRKNGKGSGGTGTANILFIINPPLH